jgi:integrase
LYERLEPQAQHPVSRHTAWLPLEEGLEAVQKTMVTGRLTEEATAVVAAGDHLVFGAIHGSVQCHHHVACDDYYAAWLLFATTGMRRGEVAGLSWSDIDLDVGTLRVAVTLGIVDGKATWKPRPKTTAGERSMSLDPATVDALRVHRKVQAEHRLRAGHAWQTRQYDWRGAFREDLVFTWADGRMVAPERYSRWFKRHRENADLPKIRLHDYPDICVIPTRLCCAWSSGVATGRLSA